MLALALPAYAGWDSSQYMWSYFGPSENMLNRYVKLVEDAKESIYCTTYEMGQDTVVDALCAAKGRGVDVQVVMDHDYYYDFNDSGYPVSVEADVQKLITAGIDVFEDDDTDAAAGRNGIMHNKFSVFDGRFVWTGSTNLVDNDFLYNNNNSILIDSEELSKFFTRKFDQYRDGYFHSETGETEGTVYLDDLTRVDYYFNPTGEPIKALRDLIENAASSIYFAIFTFTSDEISEALINKHKAGIHVEGVFDKTQGSNGKFLTLNRAGLPVKYDANFRTKPGGLVAFMHNKVMIIDNKIVVTGSANFTGAALRKDDQRNDENMIIIYDEKLASIYYAAYLNIYGTGSENESLKIEPVNELFTRPNPFGAAHSSVTIVYNIGYPSEAARVKIYTVSGEEVAVIGGIPAEPGYNTVTWDGRESSGEDVPNGIYIVQVSCTVDDKEYRRGTKLIVER